MLAIGAGVRFGATAFGAVGFDAFGGGNIMIDGQPLSEGMAFVSSIVPALNAILAAVTALVTYYLFSSKERIRTAGSFVAVSYSAGTLLAWIFQSAPFVPYYGTTEGSIYTLGPAAVFIAAGLRRANAARRTKG